jgi:hypothetical protein
MNMKFSKIAAFLLPVVIISCTKAGNSAVQNGDDASTYMQACISNVPNTRSTDTWEGRSSESYVSNIGLISSSIGNRFWDRGDLLYNSNTNTYTVIPFKATIGDATLGMTVNMDTITYDPTSSSSILYGSQGNEIADIGNATASNSFYMTTSRQSVTILPNISYDEALQGPDNHYSFQADRIVAQAILINALDDSYNEYDGMYYPTRDMLESLPNSDYGGYVDVTSLAYSIENGAVSEYLLPENAGTLSDDKFSGYKSYLHDKLTDFASCKDADYVKPYLIRLGNLAPYDSSKSDGGNSQLGGYKAISVFSSLSEAQADATRGIYFFENSIDSTYMTESNKDYGYYRLTYVKLYATFIPGQLWTLQGDSLVKAVNVGPNTFYRGAEDGLFYSTREAAAASKTNPGQGSYTYLNGKCAWRALLNRQVSDTDNSVVTCADTRRNMTYIINIKAINHVGMPWDPSDPNDPNLPKTDGDPDTPPDIPDIEPKESYMEVYFEVKPWTLYSKTFVID